MPWVDDDDDAAAVDFGADDGVVAAVDPLDAEATDGTETDDVVAVGRFTALGDAVTAGTGLGLDAPVALAPS
ncbi:hypothetical protein ACFOYW_10280 [Gryllotalpicola reticulitermitis]|uniref:Uncharacterized protein n=1 Tax=Gryllotalpicola reticulitermitis TaxID=1184153 RepID=A0ABV8Q8K4_9MICO